MAVLDDLGPLTRIRQWDRLSFGDNKAIRLFDKSFDGPREESLSSCREYLIYSWSERSSTDGSAIVMWCLDRR